MYGVAEFEPLWDAAQHAPEEHLRANRSSTTPVRSAAANETAPAASRASVIRLPPANEVARWLAALVDRDGDDAVVAALLQSVPGPRMMAIVEELCVQRFGIDPILCDDRGQETGGWEGAPKARTASPASVLLTKTRARTSDDGYSAFHPKRCFHCAPYMGRKDKICVAKQKLGDLEEEFEDQARKVEEEEANGDPDGEARRSARYYLYRKWVYAAYGFLGKGKRVQIPACVVEYIRNRFREPNCKCLLGGPLFNCRDYTGHRAAPDGGEEEE